MDNEQLEKGDILFIVHRLTFIVSNNYTGIPTYLPAGRLTLTVEPNLFST